jgi:hypothetical protein
MYSAKLIVSDFLKWLGRQEDDTGVWIFISGFGIVLVMFVMYELCVVARYIGVGYTIAFVALAIWLTAGYISWRRYIQYKSRIIVGNPRDKQE